MRVGNSVIASAGLVASGDGAPERAFEAVVTADVRRLYSLAPSILDDAGEAEDAVQETLLKAWKARDALSQMDRQAAWLNASASTTASVVAGCFDRVAGR